MKVYLTSIGERTTIICRQQLESFGLQVHTLYGPETWFEKYKKFITMVDEDCLRIDADVIVNREIKRVADDFKFNPEALMIQYAVFDLYQNNIHTGQPVAYTAKALEIIRSNFDKLDPFRPEASAWRLPEINPHTLSINAIMGMHGFGSDMETINRAERNKVLRKQESNYDFDLVKKIIKLYG